MKSGLRMGAVYTYEVVVTYEMRAHFGNVTVHEVYGTPAMLSHMEWATRQHILPFLEPGEEGVGYQMTIEHWAPTPIGATVRISATVMGIWEGKVACHCEAFSGGRKVGQARVVQAVLPLTRLHAKMAQ